VQVTE
jgi:hypothetical protein